jgi:hypothetical protein
MSYVGTPRFWAGPLRYSRWAARERPAYFWSCVIAACGPLSAAIVLPIRKAIGDEDAPQVPLTYPGIILRTTLVTCQVDSLINAMQSPLVRERNLPATTTIWMILTEMRKAVMAGCVYKVYIRRRYAADFEKQEKPPRK